LALDPALQQPQRGRLGDLQRRDRRICNALTPQVVGTGRKQWPS